MPTQQNRETYQVTLGSDLVTAERAVNTVLYRLTTRLNRLEALTARVTQVEQTVLSLQTQLDALRVEVEGIG